MTKLPPPPDARAPRLPLGQARDCLHWAPAALQGALVAVLTRDTRGAAPEDAQRLSHFPASPLLCLAWYQDLEIGLYGGAGEACFPPTGGWRPAGTRVTLSGSQSRPVVSWAPTPGRGGMVCFTAEVARSLLGVDPGALHDRFVDAYACQGEGWTAAAWRAFLDALAESWDDRESLAVLCQHLGPRWRGGGSPLGSLVSHPLESLRRQGRHWVERLAWQAQVWRRDYSPRQVERRIKAFSGRSLREWQSLVRTEGVFFAARARHEAGEPLDWADLAVAEGFADQAHMSRACKRITGFSPTEFTQRYLEDESFWVYRLWV